MGIRIAKLIRFYALSKIGPKLAGLPPDGTILIQQNDGGISIFNQMTDEVYLTFSVKDSNALAIAQGHIWHHEKLTDEQKCFAIFWSGYFYAYSCMQENGIV